MSARRQLLRGSVVALASAAMSTSASAEPARIELSPDAELIALCQAHPGLLDAVNAPDRDPDCDLDDSNPTWRAYVASLDAIRDAKPQTLEGMRAKALAAMAECRGINGGEAPDHCSASGMAWDLLNDLLRLTGGAA